ncbi:hypothetical protein FXO37_26491 [Capsicum annuum]|nr:hypothetical protein FXO37_26491 [Capsicum annuum]
MWELFIGILSGCCSINSWKYGFFAKPGLAGWPKEERVDKGASSVGSKREKSFRLKEKSENGDIRVGSFDRKPNGSKKIGQGTYSSVYKACELLNDKLVALKKVRFEKMDPESIKFMGREIVTLRRLDHPNIIKLEGLVVSRTSCSLYRVFEYMEHDLTSLATLSSIKFTEPQVLFHALFVGR